MPLLAVRVPQRHGRPTAARTDTVGFYRKHFNTTGVVKITQSIRPSRLQGASVIRLGHFAVRRICRKERGASNNHAPLQIPRRRMFVDGHAPDRLSTERSPSTVDPLDHIGLPLPDVEQNS